MSFFDCDNIIGTATGSKTGAGQGVGAGAPLPIANPQKILSTLNTVSSTLFFCGFVPLVILPFLEPKQMYVPAIVGYSCLLIGTAALGASAAMKVTSGTGSYTGMQKFRVGSIFFSLILIISIMMSRYTNYKSEIASGNVPQLGMFSLFIIMFIGLQLYEILKMLNKQSTIIQITSTFSSTLLFYKLISYILVICLTITLKYYVTDG
jgi:hypothetical protein